MDTSARSKSLTLLALFVFALAPFSSATDEKELKSLERQARDRREDRRLAAYEGLLLHSEEGRSKLKAILARKWEKDFKAYQKALGSGGVIRAGVKWVKKELAVRREAALEAIFDRRLYPNEAHGKVGQPEVDRRVDRVRELWLNPAAAWLEESTKVQAVFDSLDETWSWFLEVEAPLPKDDQGQLEVENLLRRANEVFDVRSYMDKGVLEANRKIEALNNDSLTSADEEEWAVVEHTNDYRWMLGMKIFEIDERLVRASRKHSEEMKELDYFGHDSPIEANRSPTTRAKREGYPSGVAENVASARDGEGAFNGWYRSSGHHRNMLGKHRHIGVGRAGRLYTECFGSGPSLSKKAVKADPRLVYLAKRRRSEPQTADEHVKLAKWCRAQKLELEMNDHAQKALELEPDHGEARRLLGHVREGDRWVEGSSSKTERDWVKELAHPESQRRKEALAALAEEGDEKALGRIRRCLKDETSEVRAEAARVLAHFNDRSSAPSIGALLEDKNNYTRHTAARALFDLGDGAGVDVLIRDLDSRVNNTRINASKTLRTITGKRLGYAWDLPLTERKEAIARWKEWWSENREQVLRVKG